MTLLQRKACNDEIETNVMLALLFYVAITGKPFNDEMENNIMLAILFCYMEKTM